MQEMEISGKSTSWSFDECLLHTRDVTNSSIVEATTDDTKHWDFEWTKGSKISYYEMSQEDPIPSTSWQMDGHTCRPQNKVNDVEKYAYMTFGKFNREYFLLLSSPAIADTFQMLQRSA